MGEARKVGKRTAKAQETRRRILAAAGELFVERGYGATSLQEVAERAGVAVQTIYFVFGNKRTVLKELVDVTIAGDDEPVATLDRQWFRDAVVERTAEAHLRAHVAGTTVILRRVAPITEVLTAASATDPEVAAIWSADVDPRYTVQAADVLYGLLSTEVYLLFVRERGWSPERWEHWVLDILRAQLCTGSTGEPADRPLP